MDIKAKELGIYFDHVKEKEYRNEERLLDESLESNRNIVLAYYLKSGEECCVAYVAEDEIKTIVGKIGYADRKGDPDYMKKIILTDNN